MKYLCQCFLLATLPLLFWGCTGQAVQKPTATPTSSPLSQKHEHHHTAPHGGALVVLGEELAHLEFVLDQKTGTLTAYVLDGEAENAVRIPGTALELKLAKDSALSLQPVADELTGETKAETSTFRGESEGLKGVDSFEAVLVSIDVKGQSFNDVAFRFPEGNEQSEHDHDAEEEHTGHDSH